MRVKLTFTQLNKSKYAAKSKTGTISRIYKKKCQDEELPHELFRTTRQTNKIEHPFAKHMSTDIKLCKARIFKIIQSGGFVRNMLGNLGIKVIKTFS